MSTARSMDQVFIEKLTNLIEINLDNDRFGVKELAQQLDISRSVLHRKIKSLYKKSSSQFIREYRLEKAYHLLKNSKATASEIANQVGFNSDTYFNSSFHDFYGFPPGEAKFRLNPKIERQASLGTKNSNTPVSKILSTNSFSTYLLGMGLIVIILYLFYYNFLSDSAIIANDRSIAEKSIAILPCRNLSTDPENQYFADGVMSSVHNNLNKIEELRVISETSMHKYKKSTLTVPEIAKELNVNYLLEASVQQHNNKVQIIAKLIDAQKDKQIWSDEYVRDLEQIFELQSELSLQIVRELKTVLTEQEEIQFRSKATNNIEAYKLYLQGRMHWHERNEKDLKKSLYYYTKALELDSTYSLALAGMADSYFIMAWWQWYPKEEGLKRSKNYAKKALEYDKDNAQAYATLGSILCWNDWNWKESEKYLKKSISLAPNYATAHQYYAELLDVLRKREEALYEINLAVRLNPNSFMMTNIRADLFNRLTDCNNSIKASASSLELTTSEVPRAWVNYRTARCFLREGKTDKAYDQFKQMVKFYIDYKNIPWNNEMSLDVYLNGIYQNQGMRGFLTWFLQWTIEYFSDDFLFIAQNYVLLGDRQNALVNLEKFIESKSLNSPWINLIPEFDILREEPRFIALLEKMNLPITE